MRASSGLYISRLDHIRGLAAFMVFFWHFTHVHVPFEYVPTVPLLSLLEEGHMGVGLFMTLSGYLFAKVIDGRSLDLARFYLNRVLRLAPLLVLVLVYWAMRGRVTGADILPGLVTGKLPGGTWSIVVELHFYALFPLLAWLQRARPTLYPLAVLAGAIALRAAIWTETGNAQDAAYWTIIGCIDFFVVGMLACEVAKSQLVRRRAALVFWGSLLAVTTLAHAINMAGGFYSQEPLMQPAWIVIPTLEAACFAGLIVGYEAMALPLPRILDRVLAKIGEVSYSIYLLHFIVFAAAAKALAAFVATVGLDMADFTTSAVMALVVFPAVVLGAIASYELIEKPFLRLRMVYQRLPGSGHMARHPVSPA